MTRRVVLTGALGLAGVLSVAVFVGAFGEQVPGDEGPAASPAGGLFRGVLYTVLAGLALVLLIGLVRELRRRSGAQVGHRRLELIWTAIPVAALIALAVGERELRAGEPAAPVELTASLAGWTGAELEVAEGRPLAFTVRALDEQHVLSAPGLGLVLAVHPDGTASAVVAPPEAGTYELSCTLHGRSVGRLRVAHPR